LSESVSWRDERRARAGGEEREIRRTTSGRDGEMETGRAGEMEKKGGEG